MLVVVARRAIEQAALRAPRRPARGSTRSSRPARSPATTRRRACCRAARRSKRALGEPARRRRRCARASPQATAGGPLPASRLGAFVAEVAGRASAAADHARRSLAGTRARAARRRRCCIERRGGGWTALLPLQPARPRLDAARLRSRARRPARRAGDRHQATSSTRCTPRYLREALVQVLLGALAVVLLLAWQLRSRAALLAVCQPLALAVLLTLGGAGAARCPLGILHLVGLLLVVAVGSNYALFFDRCAQHGRADDDTLASLLLANLTTVLSFGLIALSRHPGAVGDRPRRRAGRAARAACCGGVHARTPWLRISRPVRRSPAPIGRRSPFRMTVASSARLADAAAAARQRRGCMLLAAGAAVCVARRGWPWALGAVVLANHALLTAAGLWPRSRLLGPNVTRLPAAAAARGEIALTIDDGPDPRRHAGGARPARSRTARARPSSASPSARAHTPALAREIVARGHSVQNHSRAIATTSRCSGRARLRALRSRARRQMLADSPAACPRCFRAPAGLRNPFLDPVLHRLGLPLVSWTRRGFDTRERDAAKVLARLDARPGRRRHPAAARRPRGAHGASGRAGGARRAAAAARSLRRCRAADGDAAERAAAAPRLRLPHEQQPLPPPRRRRRIARRRVARAARRRQRAVPQRRPLRLALRARQAAARPGVPRAARARRPRAAARACSTSAAARACSRACSRRSTPRAHAARGRRRWPRAPAGCRYTGIELMPRDVERARAALRRLPRTPQFVCARHAPRAASLQRRGRDPRRAALRRPTPTARACCVRVRAALPPRGRLLLRVGDAASRRGFAISQWVDRTVDAAARPSRRADLGPHRSTIGWRCSSASASPCSALPMSHGTPFANVLLVAPTRRDDEAARRSPTTPSPARSASAAPRRSRRCAPARSGLRRRRFESVELDSWIGEVDGVDAVEAAGRARRLRLPQQPARLARPAADGFAASVQRARARHGAQRVGVFLGTSTSGILQTELAYRRRDAASGALPADFRYAQTHDTYSVGRFRAPALRPCAARRAWCRPRARRAPRCSAARRA